MAQIAIDTETYEVEIVESEGGSHTVGGHRSPHKILFRCPVPLQEMAKYQLKTDEEEITPEAEIISIQVTRAAGPGGISVAFHVSGV